MPGQRPESADCHRNSHRHANIPQFWSKLFCEGSRNCLPLSQFAKNGWTGSTEFRGWTMKGSEAPAVPAVFRELWDAARRALEMPAHEREERLRALPVSRSRAADLVENDPAFHSFVQSSPWDARMSAWRLSEGLRRAGFYQAVQNGGDITDIWSYLSAQMTPRLAPTRTLLLLEGCWFPLDRFKVAGGSVERLSTDALEALGPRPDIASSFFPAETLAPSWFTQLQLSSVSVTMRCGISGNHS